MSNDRHGRQCGYDLVNCPNRVEHMQQLRPQPRVDMTDSDVIAALRAEGSKIQGWSVFDRAANRIQDLTERIADLKKQVESAEHDRDLALRRAAGPAALAQHYIDAQAAAGDAWRGKAAADDRAPLPPDVLTGALQDRVHVDDGPSRPASSVRAAPAAPPLTVGELLARLDYTHVIEFWDVDIAVMQICEDSNGHIAHRMWDDGWDGEWIDSEISHRWLSAPARLVPADEADADPATRKPS